MDHKNSSRQVNQRTRQGMLVAIIILITNTLLVILKYWVGLQLSSVAIMAEAWHSLSDSLTTIIVLVGFKMASKPADKEHPFGHGRMEVISSLIIALVLFLVVFNFFVEATNRLIQRQSVQYTQTALIIFIISLAVKELMAQVSIRVGRKIKSDSLITDGWHHRSDAFASLIVVVGIFLNPYFWWIDGVMGIIISLIIAKIAFDILRDTISRLIGEKPEESFIRELEKIVRENTFKDVKLHHVHLHKYGNHRELTLHIVLPKDMKLDKAHQIATDLEKIIDSEMSVDTTIHVESEEAK